MTAPTQTQPPWFDAFIKAAQYIVRIKSQQDVWEHLAKLVVTQFPGAWVAFARRDSAGEISLHHSTLPEGPAQLLLDEPLRAAIGEVLDSGFLASHVVAAPAASMAALLPIIKEYQAREVMLIGHEGVAPLPKELLDVYLAVAGLAGTAFERLDSEQELYRHRMHLEELVRERTAALAQAQRQNELILNSVREGICGVDLEGRIVFVNPFAAQLLGWEQADLIGRGTHDTFHHTRPGGCAYPAGECALHATLADRDAREAADEEFYRKDGARFPVEFRTAPLIEEGKLVGAVIVFRDITERKQAEARLQESERRLRTILDALPVAVFLIDAAGDVVFTNGAVERIWGMSPHVTRDRYGEYRARWFATGEPVHPDQWAAARVLETGEPFVNDLVVVEIPGRGQRILYNFALPICDGGRMLGIVVVTEDVTQRVEAQEQVRLAKDVAERTAVELARSNRDLEQFAYVASHDLQEPLRMISGYLDLLAERYKGHLDEKADKYIYYAVDGAERMSGLIRDLLAFSRVNTRGESLGPVSSQAALELAIKNLQRSIETAGAAVTHDPLPTVRGDRTQLLQLFQNLIGNAIKFRAPNRPCRIHVSALQEQDQWLFTVRDNGIGFEQEYEAKMFLIFQRLHDRRRYPGTGIGLAICKRIVERHGGRIWATGQPDQGAVFSFTIPVMK